MNFWNQLPKNFTILAPMEGVTDIVFRQVIARAGRPDVFFTEFTNVSSFASEKGHANALERLEIAHDKNGTPVESPIVAQIWGKNPDHFSEVSYALASLGFDGLDINMGCPDKHVNKAGGGAAMIKTPDLAVECIRRAKESTELPVSVKTRLGFSFIDEYKSWLPLLLGEHLAALTVHLRTRKEMSKVSAHYELIPEIVRLRDEISLETKLIINGDIKDRTHANVFAKKYPGVDGFMIGRGVFQNPWCFNKKLDISFDQAPTTTGASEQSEPHSNGSERVLLAKRNVELLKYHLDLHDERRQKLEQAGSYYAFEPLKHFFKIYINNFPGASDLRVKLMDCKTTAEVRQVLSDHGF